MGSALEPLSWRDPEGFVVKFGARILRAVMPEKAPQIQALLNEKWVVNLMAEGLLPATVGIQQPPLKDSESWTWFEHQALAFPCYPHEITALQLFDAADLTLKIAIEAAQHDWILKDASAWNVLYSKGRPVFVDLLSFSPLESSGTWLAYGQFVRNFILPLLLHKKFGMTPPEIFTRDRDGVTPERASHMMRGFQRVSPFALEFAILPTILAPSGRRLIDAQKSRKPRQFATSMARELLLGTLKRLRRKVQALRPDWKRSESTWKRYEEDRLHYSDADLSAKKTFVRRNLTGCPTVLDLGCNAGEFSLLAADCGSTVVAADFDHPALSRLYSRIQENQLPITPLMLNIGRPTPAVGWQNLEVSSILERSTGKFDCILVLGLLHHLIVSERASLHMFAELITRLEPRRLILEWIDPKDKKFQQLAGLNQSLYDRMDAAQLEACFEKKFHIDSKLSLPCGTRIMYSWTRNVAVTNA